ncbi:hypothetical protein ERJ75_001331300 [Trypanosoma vivax]|uniref:Uncharacterized protein n=1 Tax=Trypanosoma vivax (strain Y486) TaxID=1055687 RepID=G0TRQ3_TRYVY|nr:hypothetical protein TRVL_04907 [Trypanosoma vivax]KAH8608280.1 hypothetical protein ERJ75_001331300 [Trypanosoma vivax]CCC46625.1 conserved hypothetical protein [Trypanosoma vivax Y486]
MCVGLALRGQWRGFQRATNGAIAQTTLLLRRWKTQKQPNDRPRHRYVARSADSAAELRRTAFLRYVRDESSPFTGLGSSSPNFVEAAVCAGAAGRNGATRHVLETIDVRPPQCNTAEEDDVRFGVNESVEGKPGALKRTSAEKRFKSRDFTETLDDPWSRGRQDLRRLQHYTVNGMKAMQKQRLQVEFQRSVAVLHDILAGFKAASMPPDGCNERSGRNSNGAASGVGKRLMMSEAVRFKRLHQLRDTTNRLTIAHFALLPRTRVLEFLDLVSQIVVQAGCPQVTAHGYVVRQAVKALFSARDMPPATASGKNENPYSLNCSGGQDAALHAIHYYKLLRCVLLLPAPEAVRITGDSGILMSVEEFCVRRLCSALNSTEPTECFLDRVSALPLGSHKAVRVVSWCMRCTSSASVTSLSRQSRWSKGGSSVVPPLSSSLPPAADLRIPFGVGKEYTQSVLANFVRLADLEKGRSNEAGEGSAQLRITGTTDARSDTELCVRDLAVLCCAVVYYKITTADALEVLVGSVPLCALHVDELTGHELGCVMMAFATLNYHGDLTKHAIFEKLAHPTNVSGRGVQMQTNFYLLLAKRACQLGEGLHEDDAARVLRALDVAGIEDLELKSSLSSAMRFKALRRPSLFASR